MKDVILTDDEDGDTVLVDKEIEEAVCCSIHRMPFILQRVTNMSDKFIDDVTIPSGNYVNRSCAYPDQTIYSFECPFGCKFETRGTIPLYHSHFTVESSNY